MLSSGIRAIADCKKLESQQVGAMRILIEWGGGDHLKNMGDVAMLQIAVERLHQLFPGAQVQVFTSNAERLLTHCPKTVPVSVGGREIWNYPLASGMYNRIPIQRAVHYFLNLDSWLHQCSPSLVQSYFRFRLKNEPKRAESFEDYVAAVHNADLVLGTGGGYITDAFAYHAGAVLSTLAFAAKLGKPTAMLGQGLGPIQKTGLFRKAKAIFPSVDLFAIREKRTGLSLLQSFGVEQDKIITTGDDAIELAYRSRRESLGDGIGINLRIATYSSISSEMVEAVRLALHAAAKKLAAPLFPVPIEQVVDVEGADSDAASIQKILKGYDDTSTGGTELTSSSAVIRQISQCRVVVTGSYHAGVFALSQGIPVIGLVKSQYYADKFLGLADQFRTGCTILFLGQSDLEKELFPAIVDAWERAEDLRPELLKSAQTQIKLGHAAYSRVYSLV
jgi:colanic acid/amylovoran biosynthesis protein